MEERSYIGDGMTLYLKYRPQKISELDLVSVREMLLKMIRSENLPHAWIFSGPRGTGKTSAARILAKAVNCQKRKDGEPCNKCDMCQAITSGTAVDVTEIDAASNRGIDEIRELKERVALAPMQAKIKIYIIDEVHMLTTEAANALLKTLEEPPENTMFFLCTTEPEKLPSTVISRCTRIQFSKPTVSEIADKLERVANEEKFEIKRQDLESIALMAKGSFRDGIKTLEQAIMSGQIGEILVMGGETDPEGLILLVKDGKADEAIKMVETAVKKGLNIRYFVERLAEVLHGELINNSGKDMQNTIKLIEGLEEVYERTKTSAVAQLPLEVWILENAKKDVVSPKSKEIIEIAVVEPEVKKSTSTPHKFNSKGKYKLTDLTDRWQEILKKVKPMNHSVEALLRSTKPIEFDGERLELEVFYKFHMDKLASEKCRQIVESAVAEVFDADGVKLFMKLGNKVTDKNDEVTATGVDEGLVAAAEAIFKTQAV